VANRIIERLRMRVPYIRRLHRQIDELRHRLAQAEAAPELAPALESDAIEIADQFRVFLRGLQPHDVPGHSKRRIGAARDGGYVMLDDFAAARNALSLGIGNDVSWDLDMAARGFRVFQYDPTVAASPEASPHFAFHRNRVVGRRRQACDVTLAEIMDRPELAADRDVIAKIDIEDAEWEVLAKTDPAVLRRIRQIAVEFGEIRRFADRDWRTVMLAAVKNITTHHACIHIHGNNWGPFTVVGGIPFPNFFEVTLVRRADYRLVPSSATFPTEFDRPNNPKMPDFHLGRWDY
jgi:methyltransferase FkbM-like protein